MAVNLWPNADLESDIADWNDLNLATVSHSSTRAWQETNSLRIDTNASPYSGAVSDIKSIIDPSTQYTFSFYAYIDGADVDLRFEVLDQDENQIAGNTWASATSGEWVRYELAGWTGGDDTGIKIKILQFATSVDTLIYVDGAMFETGGTASTWVNYVAPGTDINVGNVGDVGIDGFNPATLSADTTFTVGNVGGVSIAGKNPTVGLPTYINVLNVGAVAIAGFAASVLQAIEFTVSNVGRVVISGLNADVSEALSAAASGITRIAMKMATILRR